MMKVNPTEEISPQEAKVLDRILEDIKNAGEVKRFDTMEGVREYEDGRYVLHTDYAALACELAEYKAKARRWYQPDGSFVELTEDEVIEKRKQAAKDLSELAATRAALLEIATYDPTKLDAATLGNMARAALASLPAIPMPAEPQCSHGAVMCQVCGHRTAKGGAS